MSFWWLWIQLSYLSIHPSLCLSLSPKVFPLWCAHLPGINTVQYSHAGLCGWDVGAHLSHDTDQGHLTDVGAFTPHVWTGDNHRSLAVALQTAERASGRERGKMMRGDINNMSTDRRGCREERDRFGPAQLRMWVDGELWLLSLLACGCVVQ